MSTVGPTAVEAPTQARRVGVLLLQLGTPDSPSTPDVRRYLREFLSDPRVIDLPAPQRWLLVNLVIAPFRAPRSAHAYRTIWTPEGSPLLVHTRALADGLRAALGVPVAVGMRYGKPGMDAGLDALGDVDRVLVVPLYPQYAGASWGTAVEALYRALAARSATPAVEVLEPLLRWGGWARAVARSLGAAEPDEVTVFSFHGLPERQVRAARPGCLAHEGCCDRPDAAAGWCYRAQCLASARAIAAAAGLDRWEVAFQSRLGRERWIGPSLEDALARLARDGARVRVACPSFTADCLETLEEVGDRARATFLAGGGAAFRTVPCLNADPAWVDDLAAHLRVRLDPPGARATG